MHVGIFEITGYLLKEEEWQLVVPLDAPEFHEVKFSILPNPPAQRAFFEIKDWVDKVWVTVVGKLYPATDTLKLSSDLFFFHRRKPDIKKPIKASLWVFVSSRASEETYLAKSNEEALEEFPIDSPLPMITSRFYYLEGRLSPRTYQRTGIHQVRFKAEALREGVQIILE